MNGENGAKTEESTRAALKDLERAEAEVLELLAHAEGTMDELKRVPDTSEDALRELSQGYLKSVKTVQATLKKHAAVLDEKPEEAELATNDDKNGGFQQQYTHGVKKDE